MSERETIVRDLLPKLVAQLDVVLSGLEAR